MRRSIFTFVTLSLLSFTLLVGWTQAQTPATTIPSDSTVIRIASLPDSAQVAVGGRMVGETPFNLHAKRGDTLALWLSTIGFRDWTTSYVPGAADTSQLLVRLERENPTLSIVVEKPTTAVILDGKCISKGSIFDHIDSQRCISEDPRSVDRPL